MGESSPMLSVAVSKADVVECLAGTLLSSLFDGAPAPRLRVKEAVCGSLSGNRPGAVELQSPICSA